MKRVPILFISFMLLLLSACGSGKVSPPFSYNNCSDFTIDDAVAKLEECGFTNIVTSTTPTRSADKDGMVSSVSIDGNFSFTVTKRYDPDVRVSISYFEMKEEETDPTPEPTSDPDDGLWTDPEMIRDFAQSLDSSTRDLCSLSEAAYDDFLAVLSNENTSSLDRYNAAQALQSTLGSYLLQLMDKECPEVPSFAHYQECAENYISYMMGVADATMTYLDDPTTSNLAAVQSDMDAVPQYAQYTVAARSAFLSDAGFSQEEIDAMSGETE